MESPSTLYQIAPIARPRDAVGRMALGLQELTAGLGYRSLLFTERQQSMRFGKLFLGPLRKGVLHAQPDWGDGETVPPALSIYHHSIGSQAAERFLEWPARKRVLLYHNITPAELLDRLSPGAGKAASWGREQLRTLVARSDLQIGLSAFSCRELREAGARSVVQLPYFLWRRNFPLLRRPSRHPVVLVVGRVEPHKRILETLEVFRLLRERQPGARLFIIGNKKGRPDYVQQVQSTIARHRLQESVQLTGRISDRRLNRFYRKAWALLTLSEHEGFCVPLIEAMRARLPIVAFAAGAIPETLGTGGILLTDRDPGRAAETLRAVLTDASLVERIRTAQAAEARRFEPETFTTGLREALARLEAKCPEEMCPEEM